MWPKAISMIANGDLPLEDIITDTFPLIQFKKGIDKVTLQNNKSFDRLELLYQVLSGRDNIKVMLIP